VTRDEVQRLLAVAAGVDRRYVFRDENESKVTREAWYMVLESVSYADALAAVTAHYARATTAVMPADVLAAVKAARKRRIDEGPVFDPAAYGVDPDRPVEYQAALVDHRRRVADGLPPKPAPAVEGRQRPVAALLASGRRRAAGAR
jgi:hypothetical protein